ncbi:MAG TPA: hypothetical protein VFW71_05915 [Actinomycetota bacterium]|nr:hypothetical protein [Actinomycetota bacterium]
MPDPTSSLATTNLLIGIDDTDGEGSRGTGALAVSLIQALDADRVGAAMGVTRHQLYRGPGVEATSENVALCLALKASHRLEPSAFVDFVSAFLEAERGPGSAPGVAIAREPAWEDAQTAMRLTNFGQQAKSSVVDVATAQAVAPDVHVHLASFGGSDRGVVGALAAVALHASGEDGIFLWLPDLEDAVGQITYRQLRLLAPAIDIALDPDGREPEPEQFVDVGTRVRPVLFKGLSVLLLDPPIEETAGGGFGARPTTTTRWVAAPREVILQH